MQNHYSSTSEVEGKRLNLSRNDEVVADYLEEHTASPRSENNSQSKVDAATPIANFGSSPVRSIRTDLHPRDFHASQSLLFPLVKDPNSTSEGGASQTISTSLFDRLVKEVQHFLLSSFLSHPTLRSLLVLPSSSSYANNWSASEEVVMPLETNGEKENGEKMNFSLQPHFETALSSPPCTFPSQLSGGELRHDFTLDASFVASPSSSPPATFTPAEEMGTRTDDAPATTAWSGASLPSGSQDSHLRFPVVLVRDFPFPLRGGTRSPIFSAASALSEMKAGSLPRGVGEMSPTETHATTAMRVEIHYCDPKHEVAKCHGLHLFLLARRVHLKHSRKEAIPPHAFATSINGNSSIGEGGFGRSQSVGNVTDQVDTSGTSSPDYLLWMTTTSSHLNTFFLSVLWTASCNLFSSGGPLQLDVQLGIHRQSGMCSLLTQQGFLFSNILQPPPPLAYGGPLRLPSIFPMSSTAVPCFVAGSAQRREESAAFVTTTQRSYDEVDHFVTGTVNASSVSVGMPSPVRVFRGLTSVYTSFSTLHRFLVALSTPRAFCVRSDDRGAFSFSPSLSFAAASPPGGNGGGGSDGARASVIRRTNCASLANNLPPSHYFMSQFFDLPFLSISGLPPISSDTTALSSAECESGGSEMVQYLLEYFKWQLGQRARTREWRRLRNDRSSNTALVHALDRGGGTGPPMLGLKSKTPSCCISLRKLYKYSIPRQTSMFQWKSIWKELIEGYNLVLSTRCGDTTYPIGLTSYPIECIEFQLQFHQLDEEEVRHSEALNPFTDGALRNGFIAETCTIKGRAVLGKQDDGQSKVIQKIRPVLRNYLKLLRRSLDCTDAVSKCFQQSISDHSPSEFRRNSASTAADSRILSLIHGGGSPVEEDGEQEPLPRRLAKRAVTRVMDVAKSDASMQLALVNHLADGSDAKREGKTRFPQATSEGLSSALKETLDVDSADSFMDIHSILQDLGLSSPVNPSAGSTGDLKNEERSPQATSENTSTVHDLRHGYLPGSFLCRFAFYAAEQFNNNTEEDDWLLILMDMWLMCLDEIEKYLQMSKKFPENATKILRKLFIILGLPKTDYESCEASAVDLSQTLLVQKMQFLSYCVYHLLETASSSNGNTGEHMLTAMHQGKPQQLNRDGVDHMESKILSSDQVNSDGKVREKEGGKENRDDAEAEEWMDGEVELFSDEEEDSSLSPIIKLITNGERFFPPPQLPTLPSTLDTLMEQSVAQSSASELAVAPLSKLFSLRVFNDMCLFLYCNQGRVVRFPDYVQWVSPQDFHRPVQEPCFDDNAYLSERMKIPAEVAIWRQDQTDRGLPSVGDHNACEENHLQLPVFSEGRKSGNGASHLHVGGEEQLNKSSGDTEESAPSLSTDTNNVWWILWCRAFPLSRSEIISHSVCYFDKALELVQWMKNSLSPTALCLELIQASVANAMHRLLVELPTCPSSSSQRCISSASVFRKFLQQKVSTIYHQIFPISNIFNMGVASFAACGVSGMLPTPGAQEIDGVQSRLQVAMGELFSMEIAVCSLKDLESLFSQVHRGANASSKSQLRSGEEHTYPAQLLVCPMAKPCEGERSERLNLALVTISLEDWFKYFVVLFSKKKPSVVDTQVRLTCLAERPAGTAPCFQQLVAHIKPPEEIRLSLTLSQEVL